jgi:hypothetical protein
MDPTSRIVEVFAADCVEWESLAPGAGFRSLVDAFDEAREDPCM